MTDKQPIPWRAKLIATGVHFLLTLVLATLAAATIFLVWFPAPFARMLGGFELFLLIVGCDLVLGPLLSLLVYNPRKTRLALVVDYTVIGITQLAALIYGVTIMADARPAYVAFSLDRYEIVLAGDLKPKELAAARDPRYAKVPWSGPQHVAVVIPRADYQEALFEALAGNEEHHRPKFYVPYESQLDMVRKRAKPLDALIAKHPDARARIEQAVRGQTPQGQLKWLPVRSFRGFWTAFVDDADGQIVGWLDLDPYD